MYRNELTWPVALFLTILAATLPLVLASDLAFIDYPNHLARQYIIEEFDRSQELQRFYVLRDGIYPYWSIRAVIGLLYPWSGIDGAGRTFVVLATLAPPLGALVVSRALHGKFELPALGAFALAHNEAMAWGFQGFTFSAGLAIAAFACWLKSTAWKPIFRISIFVFISSVLSLAHLLSAGIFIALSGAWIFAEIISTSGWKRLKCYAPVLELAIISLPIAAFIWIFRAEDIGTQLTTIGDAGSRVVALTSAFYSGYSMVERVLGFWLLATLFAAWWLGAVVFSKRYAWFLAIVLVLCLAAPFALFGVSFINMRLPLVLVMLAFAGARLVNPPGITSMVLGIIFALLACAKIWTFGTDVLQRGNQVTEFRTALAQLPKGVRIFSAQRYGTPHNTRSDQDFLDQVISYAVVDADAFVPRLFTMYEVGIAARFARQSVPVSNTADFDLLKVRFTEWPEDRQRVLRYVEHWRDDYDYVALFDFGDRSLSLSGTQAVSEGSFFRILKIEK